MTEQNNTPRAADNTETSGKRVYGLPDAPPMYDILLRLQKGDTLDVTNIGDIFRDQLKIRHPGKLRVLVESLQNGAETACATRTREVAETKMAELNASFRSVSYPLYCTIKKSERYGV